VTPMSTSCKAVFHFKSVEDLRCLIQKDPLALLICVGLTSADGIDGLKYRLIVRCEVRPVHSQLEAGRTGGGRDL